ncbi:MAG: hypothetical protein CMJ78_23960 [Planctomycetaceae bacterium]|nr:hypothetical protein [Planctomycetaceae bacterium]
MKCLIILLVSLSPSFLLAADVDYARDIKPVLRERCFACHGALKQESDLRLDAGEFIRKGGEGGTIIAAGDANDSEILRRVTSEDEGDRMPPEGQPLSKTQIDLLRRWIQQGAKTPASDKPEADPRQHWAFRVVHSDEIPAVDAASANSNPIDAFLSEGHVGRGLKPLGRAAKPLLLRRIHLDLIGVPPTRAELEEFLADEQPDAYERAVTRLMLDPRHGERWARHWMDVWRYTDWYGLGAQLRNSQKHIWHWRDWIVESLNGDKGYDQMVLEMLAADELKPTDTNALRGTGFLARNYYLFNRTTWMDDTIEHTSKALLGLTMNCSKCHDHKYDPITQVDYYRMRAFFEPYHVRLDSVPGETDLEKDGLPRVFDMHLDRPTYLHIRGNDKTPDKDNSLAPGVPELLASDSFSIQKVSLPAKAHTPALRSFVLDDHVAMAESVISAARAAKDKADQQISLAEKATKHPVDSGKLVLKDDFLEPNPDAWEQGPGKWSYERGKLIQAETGSVRRFVRARKLPPSDFVAKVKFQIISGQKWKSVGICFDVVDGREKLVYLSAYAGGPKLQVSYNTGSGATYPPNGLRKYPLKVDQNLTLQIAVRGQLVNASVNGQHQLAFQLPVKREAGSIDLIAFDAVAEFDEVEIRELPPGAMLFSPGQTTSGPDPKLAAIDAKLAQQKLLAAELRPAVIKAAYEADQAKWTNTAEQQRQNLIGAAARAAREMDVAKARVKLAEAERNLLTLPDKAKAAKAVNDAKAALAKAEKQLESPGNQYTSVIASRRSFTGPAEGASARFQPYPTTSTGRRTALAKWIVSRQNPLASRVAVNHIWMRHFGQPLVESVTDFGRRAKQPIQHKLLDWLAADLMDHGWSMKRLHRLIVTSEAYRRSSSTKNADPQTQSIDSNNEYYWRRLPMRMDAQVIRDSLLYLSSAMNSSMGGPSIKPTPKDNMFRRSLYFLHSRDDRAKFLAMFDDADIMNCYRRSESIVPQQALALSNSELSLTLAARISEQLAGEIIARIPAEDGRRNREFVDRAIATILCRRPTAEEHALCLEALAEFTKLLTEQKASQPELNARVNLVHALLNHNDFITIR